MSTHKKEGRWVVRWREDGRQRSLSFPTEREARAFDHALTATRQQARQAKAVREALERARQA
jgi:hypothetical protein